MRYDIYEALTDRMLCYHSTTPEGEILRSIIPLKLEHNVKEISKNYVEFSLPEMKDTIELMANKVDEDPNNPSTYRDAISFCASTTKEKVFCSEEIVGYDKATGDFNYSCIEIIENDENTLIVGGCVSYKIGMNQDISVKNAKLGKWVYNNQLIQDYAPLKEICTSRLDTIDVFEELRSIQRKLTTERYIRPENYVYAEIGQSSSTSRVTINNDGEKEEYPCDDLTNIFGKFNNNKKITNPDAILSWLNEMSDCLFVSGFNSKNYGKFNCYEFIKNAPCKEATKDSQAKTHVKTYKEIMITDPKK